MKKENINFKRLMTILIAAIMCMTTLAIVPTVSADCPSGMVGYWKLDEVSGTTAYDCYGSNNGINYGATINQPGQIGTAYDFDGIDDYVEVPGILGADMDALTLSAWVNFDTFITTEKGHGIIVKNGYPDDTTSDFAFIVQGVSGNKDDSYFQFGGTKYGFTPCYFLVTSPIFSEFGQFGFSIDRDTWYLTTATYDRATATAKIYVNGVMVASDTSIPDFPIHGSAQPVWFGKGQAGLISLDERRWMDGKIDEVAIYDRALSADEISSHYYAGLAEHGYCDCPDTVYVDDDYTQGSCGGYNWQYDAFDVIQDAIDAVCDGGTVYVAAGTYTEYLHVTTDGLTIQGAGIDQSIIDLDGLLPYWHYTGGSYASRGGVLITPYGQAAGGNMVGGDPELIEDVTFEGFTVKNAGLNPPVPYDEFIDNGDGKDIIRGIKIGSGKNILIDNCKVEYSGSAGISASQARKTDAGTRPYSEDITIRNCILQGNDGNAMNIKKCKGTTTIINNLVQNNYYRGISIAKTIGIIAITDNTVLDNTPPNWDPDRHASGINVAGKSISETLTGTISDNIVRENGYIGIGLSEYTNGITVEDNIVTGHNLHEEGAGIFAYDGWQGPGTCINHIIKNNIVTGNIRGIILYHNARNCIIEDNTITTDSGNFNPGQAAIKIDAAWDNTIKNNEINCDGTGMTFTGDSTFGNTITNNIINGAMFAGIYIRSGANDNTFTYNTIINTISDTFTQYADWGTHDGADNQAILTDSTQSWDIDEFVGMTVINLDDGSEGAITANTATNITAALSGGTENDWDTGDTYDVVYEETQADGILLRGGNCYAGGHAGTGNVFHCNEIYNNADDGMENQVSTMTVDAEYNWWGSVDGPSGVGPGSGDSVSTYIDYDPWLTHPLVTNIDTGESFCTIQAAIDDSDTVNGHTIEVHDGTYTITGKILVHKGVTITGDIANPGNVVVQYSSLTNSLIFDMRASGAVIEGFKTTNGKSGFWFDQSGVTGCTISNCIIDNVCEYGIYMKNGGSGHTIDSCTISNTGQTYAGAPAILIENSLDVTVNGNTLNSISDKGIFVRVCSASSTAERVEVTANIISGCGYPCIQVYQSPYTIVDGNTISSTADKGINIIGPNANSAAERVELTNNIISGCPWGGILVTHDRYTYIHGNTVGPTGDKGITIGNGENINSAGERIEVSGNTVTGTKYPGIQVAWAVPYTYIYDNTLTGCNYYGGDGTGDWDYASIHVDANCGNTIVDSNDVSDGINGIQIWSNDCEVTNNEIYDMGMTYADTKVTGDGTYYNSGIIIGTNLLTNNFKPTGTTVTCNSIHDNYWGLYVRDYATLSPSDSGVLSVTAECNWWGDASGPGGVGPETGNGISNYVDYSPWLGFTVGTSPMTWHTDDSIQDAIDEASNGDTIVVHDGTYVEQLTIGESITLQAGSTPIIDVSGYGSYSGSGYGISVSAPDVTIDGFEIIGIPDDDTYGWSIRTSSASNPTIQASIGADGLTVENCVFNVNSGKKGQEALFVNGGVSDVTFTGNTVNNYIQGVGARGPVDNLIVDDNGFNIAYIRNDDVGEDSHTEVVGRGIQLWYGDGLTITDNTFNGPGIFDEEWADSDLVNVYAEADFIGYFHTYCDYTGTAVVTVTGNEITNFYIGMATFADGGIMSDNNVHNNLIGLQFGQVSGTWATAPAAGVEITNNDITSNKRGIWVQSFVVDGIGAHCNNIVGNTEYGILNEDPESDTFDATCNWWGDASGPGGVGPETGNGISNYVDYSPWLGFTVGTSPMTWHTDDSIQDAIDEASNGDTIVVHDGTYVEQLTIGESITLQAGSTPIIDVSGYGSYSGSGYGISVSAPDVTIDGFEIIGIPDDDTYGWSIRTSSASNPTIQASIGADGLTVENCVFNVNSGKKGQEALFVNGGVSDVTFTGNTVNNYIQGVGARGPVDNLIVDDNGFNIAYIRNDDVGEDSHTEVVGRGIQLWYGDGLTITDNTFNGPGIFDEEWADSDLVNVYAEADFIGYFHTYCDYTGTAVVTVTGNEITNFYIGMATFADGGIMSDNNVHNNLIGLQFGQVSGTWATAPAAGVEITNNDITSNKRGIWVQSFVVDGIGAHCNNIVGNTEYGILNEDPESDTFDATCNWWGAASGPGGVGPGTGNGISNYVDYSPWLGFTVGTSPMTWHTDDSIQDAIDEASNGDTIVVHDGTYVEQLTIGESITLQAGSTPIIDVSGYGSYSGSGYGISVSAPDVTIDGFEIIGIPDDDTYGWSIRTSSASNPTIQASIGADGLTVENCVFNVNSGKKGQEALFVNGGVSDVTFTGNTVNNYIQGVGARGPVDNLIVDDNGFNIAYIRNDDVGEDSHTEVVGRGIQLWYGDGLTITDNTFNGPGIFDEEWADSDLVNVYAEADFIGYFHTYCDYTGTAVVTVTGNEITNFYIGMATFADGGIMSDNNVHNNLIGLQFGQVSGTWATAPAAGVEITNNDITSNKRGIWVQSFVVDGIGAHCNNIVGNTEYGILNEDPESDTFDATCNWWGAHDGPNDGIGSGTGDAVSTNVDYDPWIGITSLSGPTDPVQLNDPANIGFSFTCNKGTATLDLGDGTKINYSAESLTESEYSHIYTVAGVYTVTLTIKDCCGRSYSREFRYVVVYDPDDGFVTGGGWIDSLPGSHVANLDDPGGKANFGFVSKYKKGQQTPTGKTEFQFKAGDLNFHSSDYEWLVIAHHKAMYKGTGTINGDGSYGFMISAIDEDLTPSTDVDLFRIRIWDKDNGDEIVYDNNIGNNPDEDPTTAIGGGQIKVHKN